MAVHDAGRHPSAGDADSGIPREGALLWKPSEEWIGKTNLVAFMKWVEKHKGLSFPDYHALWRWSVDHLEDFWECVWQFAGIRSSAPYTRVLSERRMPGARWFPGSRLNYAEHVFRDRPEEEPAIYFRSERHSLKTLSWRELARQTARVARWLKSQGVQPGDRVAAYMPNIPETAIAFLACASIGAIWSCCSPDFGARSVLDRFQQIEPKVLFAIDGYQYNGKRHDRAEVLREVQRALPTLKQTVLVPYLNPDIAAEDFVNTIRWEEMPATEAPLTFEQVPFDHPLWILYTSGTTGIPKAIVHGHGGILLEHCKALLLHADIKPGDRVFRFTSTGWMMWNMLVSSLLVGAAIVLYDGHPLYPNEEVLWELAEKVDVTYFGTSAAYIGLMMKTGFRPNRKYRFASMRGFGSTGSALPSEGFLWVYQNVKEDLHLASGSGGTDVCASFVGGNPILPVHAGHIQAINLGVKAEAYDDDGNPVVNEMGELVITQPMPSMPLYFWNDPGNARYLDSYFDRYPNVWRHGDWIKFFPDGRSIIYGRSDATINRQGVRMGTAEIYEVVEAVDEVVDSLIVDLEMLGRPSMLLLFVVLKEGCSLTPELQEKIRAVIKEKVSPRHAPDRIYQVQEIPRTLNGKKLEVPVRRILLGHSLEKAVNIDSVANKEALAFFIRLAKELDEETKHKT